jgi:Zn-dependent protease
MEKKWKIGTLFDIPFYLDYSWFFILIFVTLINAGQLNSNGLTSNQFLSWFWGFLMALLLFLSVLLHELGHSLIAKLQGIKVNSITLFLFGGIAAIDRESSTPLQALQVAIAGPIVSFLLFGFFSLVNYLFSGVNILSFVCVDIARINLILALFNLIPGLPLDGGQILKSIVWQWTGDRFTGVLWAAASGKLIGWMGIYFGLFLLLLTGEIGVLWLSLISWFILRNAYSYERLTSLQKTLLKSTAIDVLSQQFRVVDGNLTIQDFVFKYILGENIKQTPFYASAHGRYCGLIVIEDLRQIERNEWETKRLAEIAKPLDQIPSVQEKTNLIEIVKKLDNISTKFITVLTPAGAVSGVIDRASIVEFIAKKENLAISSLEIKRVREENTYPVGLDLVAIAKIINNE